MRSAQGIQSLYRKNKEAKAGQEQPDHALRYKQVKCCFPIKNRVDLQQGSLKSSQLPFLAAG